MEKSLGELFEDFGLRLEYGSFLNRRESKALDFDEWKKLQQEKKNDKK